MMRSSVSTWDGKGPYTVTLPPETVSMLAQVTEEVREAIDGNGDLIDAAQFLASLVEQHVL
jgi:hypothetical protein